MRLAVDDAALSIEREAPDKRDVRDVESANERGEASVELGDLGGISKSVPERMSLCGGSSCLAFFALPRAVQAQHFAVVL